MSAFGTFMGGMGIAFRGARDGERDELGREEHAQDREYMQQQRDFQAGQQRRELDTQARADTLRKDVAAVKPTGAPEAVVPVSSGGADAMTDPSSIDAQNGSDVGFNPTKAATPKLRTQDQELRDIAEAYRKAGDIGKSVELNGHADRIAFARATSQFNQAIAGSQGLPIGDLARRLGKIYDADPTSGGIKGIEDIPDGVRVTITDKNSGATDTREFKGPAGRQQLINEFHSYYAPDSWNKIQEQLAAARIKADEARATKQAEGVNVPEGGTWIPGVGDPRPGIHVPKTFGPHGKPPKTPLEQAQAVFADVAEKSEDKLTTAQRAAGEDHLARLMTENENMPPAMAARVALKIVQDPTAVQPAIRIQTGRFDNMVKDDLTGEEFSIRRDVGDALHPPSGLKREDIQAKTGEMLASLDRTFPGAGALYTAAAFDGTGAERVKLEKFTSDRIRAALERSVPAFKTLAPEQQQAAVMKALSAEMPNIQSRLDLVKNYGQKPKPASLPSKGFGLEMLYPDSWSKKAG